MKRTSTLLKPSVLKAFHYQHVLYHFQYILSVPKAFRLVHKAFRFNLKVFRSVQSVQIVSYKKFRLKCYGFIWTSSGSFIVIIKMANWHRSQKLTPFIWRIILLLHISGLFLLNCTDLQVNFEFELHLQVRQVFSSMIESGTYILGWLIECNNCLSSMYLYMWGKIRVT